MSSSRKTFADYEATEPAAVKDLDNVISCAATETAIGPVLAKLAAGWTGTFVELVITAAEVADPTADDVLAFELVLDRLSRQRAEDRFFGGGAMHRADWPVRRALGDAQIALGAWREARTGCAGCGCTGLRWASSVHSGVGPSFFVEHWCADCAGPVRLSERDRVVPKPDFAALRSRYGKVVTVGSPGSGYTLDG